MLQWFHRLMPRQERFFPLFQEHAAVLVAGAQSLREMVNGGEQLSHWCHNVITQEEKADAIAREVLIGLRTTFITPFDRGDIKSLITSMDDAIDQMQQTAKSIMVFEVTTFDLDMQEMADAVLACAELVRRAIPLLSNLTTNAAALNEICLKISQIEEQADDIHDRGLKELYRKAKAGTPMDFLRGKEIYDHLEASVDRFDDVANEIQGIVLEHV